MKKLELVVTDINALQSELQDLQIFLAQSPHLRERAEIIPFFKTKKHLTAALGMLNAHISVPQLYANELQLFGDFTADAASGELDSNAVCLIEFEDANEESIFRRLEHGKTVKRYSHRFEHGYSQLVDWAWRLSTETNSDAYARIFGSKMALITFMMIIGRDSDLTGEDLLRLRWRTQHTNLGGILLQCFTFDQILAIIRRRIGYANSSPGTFP